MSCGCSAVLGRVAVTSERSCGELRALFFLTSTFKNVRAQPLRLASGSALSTLATLCQWTLRDTAPGFYPPSALREARAEDGGITREYCVLGVGVSLTLSKKTQYIKVKTHRGTWVAASRRTCDAHTQCILFAENTVPCTEARRYPFNCCLFFSRARSERPRIPRRVQTFRENLASCRRACGGCWGPLVPQGPPSRERQHDLFRRRGKDLYKHRPTAEHPQRAERRPGVTQDSTRLHGSWPHHAS